MRLVVLMGAVFLFVVASGCGASEGTTKQLASVGNPGGIVARSLSTDIPAASPTSTETPRPIPSPTPTPSRTATPSPTPSPTPKATATATAAKPASGSTSQGSVPPIIVRGDATRPVIAFTFDAGAGVGSASDLLNVLAKFGVQSTFFLTGEWSEANPDLVKRIVAGGHEVGNHSWSHPDMTELGDEGIVSQLAKTEAVVQRIAGVSTKPFFRPPFGAYDAHLLRVVAQQGYRSVYWTLDSTDWRDDSTTQSVLRRVLNNAGNGHIVVHHMSSPKTAESLASILQELKARGFSFAKLSGLPGI